MTIPFADLFQKVRSRFFTPEPPSPPSTPLPRVTRPVGDRRSKTVLPRPLTPRETFGTSAAKSYQPTAPRARELPPALAKALEPKLERAISLQLFDFIDQIPAEYVKPVEVIDANRSVTLKASELEKGMPERAPSISLASLYQQIPEIFLRSVQPSDPTKVPLPYEKVLEQFTSVQIRSDQQRDERVPQLETPILQATIEDTERFGTKMEPVESSGASPSVPIKPATAATIASAEPEAAVSEVVGSSKSPSSPHLVSLSGAESKAEKEPFDFKTEPPSPSLKIPFQFPPNGTGVPASERVPASSGPPVPPAPLPPLKLTSSGPMVEKPTETKESTRAAEQESKPIAFKFPNETAEQKKSEPLKMSSANPMATTPAPNTQMVEASPKLSSREKSTADEASTITLALKPILENIPVFQREGDPNDVPDSVKVKFPFDLVQSQLACGRVLIPAKTFQSALPPNYRSIFVVDPADTPVSLPLNEVLKSLPSSALKMRDDQQKFFPEDEIVTPISLKAKEDAERFRPAVAEIAKPDALVEKKVETKAEVTPPATEIDGKAVVSAACKLPGVAACELMFPDGLSLASNLPAEIGVDGLCAMAPTLLQRIDTHMLETKLGPLAAMTLHAKDSAITFLTAQNIFLAALHQDAAALPGETRAQLGELVEKLSRTFAPSEIQHVDH